MAFTTIGGSMWSLHKMLLSDRSMLRACHQARNAFTSVYANTLQARTIFVMDNHSCYH